MKTLIIIALSLTAVVGCSINPVRQEKQITPEPVVITKIEYISVAIPDSLLVSCKAEQPPPVKDYLAADWPNKEALLTVYIKTLLSNISVCNTKLSNLKRWSQSQKDISDNMSKVK